jgi:hypothetical protein
LDITIVKEMQNLHKSTPDIDDFLDGVVNILREANISDEIFASWYENIADDSFSNDLARVYDDWDFYFD